MCLSKIVSNRAAGIYNDFHDLTFIESFSLNMDYAKSVICRKQCLRDDYKKMPLYEDLIYNIKYIFKKSILIAIKTHDSTNINEKLLVNTSRVLCKFSHEYDESIQFLYNQLEQNISYSKKNKILISLVEHLSHFTPKLFQSLVNQINHATSPDYRKKAFDMLNLYDISQLKLLMEENTNEYQILVSRMYDEPDVKVRQEASYIFYRTEMYRTIKENAIKNLQSESPITRENAIICLESLGIVDKIILKAISELAQLDPVKSVRENVIMHCDSEKRFHYFYY
ncbi:hypothetical protein A3Q56_05897 [Intoshia linei]|uniref:Clathrin/coatomer adaptor adaptin-like N-terminal domain-containing protein n=1 Tax=Intoshia linei TaxID=1819745 RepID=A0A177AW74_9BILA|nr:hypothetical protein A3Q56_05897 [Intoshia linei]